MYLCIFILYKIPSLPVKLELLIFASFLPTHLSLSTSTGTDTAQLPLGFFRKYAQKWQKMRQICKTQVFWQLMQKGYENPVTHTKSRRFLSILANSIFTIVCTYFFKTISYFPPGLEHPSVFLYQDLYIFLIF